MYAQRCLGLIRNSCSGQWIITLDISQVTERCLDRVGAHLFLCDTQLYWKQRQDYWSVSRLLSTKSTAADRLMEVTPLWPAFMGGGKGVWPLPPFLLVCFKWKRAIVFRAWGADGLEATQCERIHREVPVTQSTPAHWAKETVKKTNKLGNMCKYCSMHAESGDYQCAFWKVRVPTQLGAHLQHVRIQSALMSSVKTLNRNFCR